MKEDQIYSVLAFTGDSTFKTKMPENVTSGMGYIRFIKSKKDPMVPEEEIPTLVDKTQSGRLMPSFKTNREHVKHVNDIVREKKR